MIGKLSQEMARIDFEIIQSVSWFIFKIRPIFETSGFYFYLFIFLVKSIHLFDIYHLVDSNFQQNTNKI